MDGDLRLEELADAAGLSITLLTDVPRVNRSEPAPVCVAPQGRARQGDVACRRDARAGCGGDLRVQEPAALCAGLPQCVRSQSYTIPAGICAPENSRGSVNKAPRFLRLPPRDRQGKRVRFRPPCPDEPPFCGLVLPDLVVGDTSPRIEAGLIMRSRLVFTKCFPFIAPPAFSKTWHICATQEAV